MVSLVFSTHHIFIFFWFLFTFSLWIFYFGLELQWMLLTIHFIIDCSIHRGLFNYLILNSILGIWLMIGILFGNSIFYILGVFGKIGYFPFFLILCSVWYYSSYVFLIYDLINKWAYWFCFLMIFIISYWFILFNFLILMLLIKLMVSIKQLLLISSLITYLFIICLILINEYLFSFSILCFYSVIIALLILLGIDVSINYIYILQYEFYILYLLSDLIKVFIIITCILVILYWLIIFSLIPTTMFLNKFFGFIFIINYSINISFYLTIISQSLYQVCFLRSCCLLILIFTL